MQVIYSVAMSLDGFIAPEDGSIDWLTPFAGSFDFAAFLARMGGLIMGRASFEQVRAQQPWDWGGRPVAVMTSRPIERPPVGVRGFSSPAAALEWLRFHGEGGDAWLFGGGRAAGQFLHRGLIDSLELAVIPVLLGGGIPLFTGGEAALLRLRQHISAPLGVQLLSYDIARDDTTGGPPAA